MKFYDTNEFDKIQFFYPSFSETISSSQSQISTPFLHSQYFSKPCSGGIIDGKLGSFDNHQCITCSKSHKMCSGHFGFLKLFLPVFNVGYIKVIHGILQIICKNCSRVLIKEGPEYQKILKFIHLLRKKDKISRARSLSLIIENCRHQKFCPHCTCKNGKIRKIGTWNFIHELKFIDIKSSVICDLTKIDNSNNFGNDIILDPLKVYIMFQKINRCDFDILDLDPSGTRPENFLLSVLPVPPLVVRPTVMISSKITNEDDLTMRLVEIQTLNLKLKNFFSLSQDLENLWEIWGVLQIECARYLNSEIFIGDNDSKNLAGIYQRLKGKNGRFRGSLGGKRVDFSGRTVISPDPNIELNSVGIPISIAIKLTFPEKISKFNRERLKRNVFRGPNVYPGANGIFGKNWRKNLLDFPISKINLSDFKEGNIIERHIKNNDIVLFNRQPSLHRISIMAHRAKIMTGKTFRLNECVCKPYNADFDGDEMNIHVPQTQKARAESISLMNPVKNSKTPRNGEPLIAATQDFLTFLYLLTSKDSFFSFQEMFKITGFSQIENLNKNKFYPTIIKPRVLWTGKQIFNLIFFSNKDDTNKFRNDIKKINKNKISSTLEEKSYSLDQNQCSPHMCPYDGWVIIRNNELLTGRIGKISIGNGNKNSLLCTVEKCFSDQYSAFSLYKISRLTYEWFSQFGLTICLKDVTPGFEKKIKTKFLIKCISNLNSALKIYKDKGKKGDSFFGEKEEIKLRRMLGKIRLKMGSICLRKKQYNINPLQLMFMAGSKGSLLNLAQMISCLGQQTVDGKRINNEFFKMAIINKKKKMFENGIILNGFVKKSFCKGLDNLEFFFHAMAGREGLVDTAVKTAETGYIQRKLSKTLEDLIVFYDSTVRTSCGRLVQFYYGEDGIDPEKASNFSEIFNLETEKIKKGGKKTYHKNKNLEIEIFSKSHALLFINSCFFSNNFRKKFLKLNKKIGVSMFPSFYKIENFLYSRVKILSKINIEAGSSVGAIAAQSIGEPCTQMTLQTFHAAGTGSVNITLGVPRINEIMNVSKLSQNSKVIFTHPNSGNKLKIMKLKIRLKKLSLNKIIEKIFVSFQGHHIFTFIKFKKDFIFLTGISDIYHILCKNLKSFKGLWKNSIFFINRKYGEIRINWVGFIEKENSVLLKVYNLFNFCKFDLPEFVFHNGFSEKELNFFSEKNIIRISINGEEMEKIINLPFVDFPSIQCNHIHKINQILGIEATQNVIIREIEKTFSSNGIFTDLRHLTLLADVITHQGELMGITRHGLPKMKSNTLALASFEKTVENLFLAASNSCRDFIIGVSENIILGKEVPVGTGLVTLRNMF
jgi:DNA-directed RNA polymerase III subunit RPC1